MFRIRKEKGDQGEGGSNGDGDMFEDIIRNSLFYTINIFYYKNIPKRNSFIDFQKSLRGWEDGSVGKVLVM